MNAGIPKEVPAFTINQVCGSGIKSLMLGVQSIISGDNEAVVVGGTENMSQAPYVLKDQRWGARMGNTEVIDTMINDGLSDAFYDYHMGVTAENIAEKFDISRKEQDEFALQSQHRTEQPLRQENSKMKSFQFQSLKEKGILLQSIKMKGHVLDKRLKHSKDYVQLS